MGAEERGDKRELSIFLCPALEGEGEKKEERRRE